MKGNNMTTLRGVATISIWAKDHAAATAWYSKLTGVEPYFERPGYAEFRLGDRQTELGIIDSSYAPHITFPGKPSGAVLYWHVDDIEDVIKQALKLGATELQAPEDRGHGFVTATLVDPFDNILGLMYNPHYIEMHQE